MADLHVTIPYTPRAWAKRLHASDKRFGALVLHRRAGKTTAVVNHHLRAATNDAWERRRLLTLVPHFTDKELGDLINPPGGRHYGHVMPTRVQAKAVAWDKLKHYASAFPKKLLKFNESELLIRFPGGHKVQLFGADDPDALRGLAFSGLSFDEYSDQPPNIFTEVLSKGLADHLGYALFVGTIKGKDQLYLTHQAARLSADWFALWQDIDTSLQTEAGATVTALRQAMIDDRKLVDSGIMSQSEFDQEWYLSTDAAIKGAYYMAELAKARADKRICSVPYDPMLPVETWWDLGMDDAMSIWFIQAERGGGIRVIDYYENTGEGMPHYAGVLKSKGYVYGRHLAPHDIAVREIGTGKSRIETAMALGVKFEPVPMLPVDDGIHACRLILSRCWFDEVKTGPGLEAMRHYRKRWNSTLNEFVGTPVHDVYSHGADAFRTGAVGHSGPMLQKRAERTAARRGGEANAGWLRG